MIYVYEHWYNGQCFYVGCGTLNRTKDLRKTHRNELYWKFCNYDRKNIIIKIIEEFEDKKEAEEFERALTMYHDYILKSPLTNINTGYKNGEIQKEKASKAKKGHFVSEETKIKISKTKKDKNVSSWNRRNIKMMINDEYVEFPSINKAGIFLSNKFNLKINRAKYLVQHKMNEKLEEINCKILD